MHLQHRADSPIHRSRHGQSQRICNAADRFQCWHPMAGFSGSQCLLCWLSILASYAGSQCWLPMVPMVGLLCWHSQRLERNSNALTSALPTHCCRTHTLGFSLLLFSIIPHTPSICFRNFRALPLLATSECMSVQKQKEAQGFTKCSRLLAAVIRCRSRQIVFTARMLFICIWSVFRI